MKAGDTWTPAGTLDLLGSGTARDPIVLTSYGSGSKPKIVSQQDGAALYLRNESHWTISHLQIELTTTDPLLSPTSQSTGIAVDFTPDATGVQSGIVIDDNDIYGNAIDRNSNGILINADYPYTTRTRVAEDLAISNNRIHDVGWRAIDIVGYDSATGINLASSQIFHNVNVVHNVAYKTAVQGILVRDANYSSMRGNLVHDVGQYQGSGNGWGVGGLWGLGLSHVVMEHNEVYHVSDGNVCDANTCYDGTGMDIDWASDNVTVQYNYVHDNVGPGIDTMANHDSIIQDNVVANNSTLTNEPGQITLTDYQASPLPEDKPEVVNDTVRNNRIVVSKPDSAAFATVSLYADSMWAGDSFANNTVVLMASAGGSRDYNLGIGTAVSNADYNSFYHHSVPFSGSESGTTYASLPAWQAGTGHDIHSRLVEGR